MGRYKSTAAANGQRVGEQQVPHINQSQQTPQFPSDWPTIFAKETIGIERNGLIVEEGNIFTPDDVKPIPESLAAIRLMRLKGYKVVIFFNEPAISEGKITPNHVNATNDQLMREFGQAGIYSIDGLFYSTSSMKQDMYSMPNNGMMKKAEIDVKVNFKGGYFVGNRLHDLKAGESSGSKPVLIKMGNYQEAIDKLDSFANKELKQKTKTYNSLLEFAEQLP